MKSNVDVLYVHGGPGLNSQPERRLLSGPFREAGIECEFWDEPSNLRPKEWPFRPDRAYTNWLDLLESSIAKFQPKVIVGASFGALAAMELLDRIESANVKHLVMVAPTLNLNRVFRDMMDFSVRDLKKVDDEKAAQLERFYGQSKTFWDQAMKSGFELVWQNPYLLTHYFRKPGSLESWAAGLADSGYQIDVPSQNAVLDEISRTESPKRFSKKLTIPVNVLAGAFDPVFDRAEVEAILQDRFDSVRFHAFPECAHFLHVEDTVGLIGILKGILS